MWKRRQCSETSRPPPSLLLWGRIQGGMDCSDWAVNLRDTAAFSAANDSLQKTDQSWSSCHVSQSHAAPHTPTPAVYSSVLRGCRWSEDDLVEGGCEEIWWWWGIGGGGAWLQFKTLMLIDHSQSMASQRCEDTDINRDALETDRSLKVWQRAISCQSLNLKAPRLLISERVHTYIPGKRQPGPELYICHITGGGKTFLLVCFLNRGHEKVLSPARGNKQASRNIKWLFTGLDTSADFSSMVADKISLTERKREGEKGGGGVVITNCRGTQLSQQLPVCPFAYW